jgi:hypothetical protein
MGYMPVWCKRSGSASEQEPLQKGQPFRSLESVALTMHQVQVGRTAINRA